MELRFDVSVGGWASHARAELEPNSLYEGIESRAGLE